MPSALLKGKLTSQQNLPGASAEFELNMSAPVTGAALEVGDFVFLFLYSSGSTANSNTPGAPTGFAEIVPWQAMGTSTSTSWSLYAKRRGVGETNYTIPQLNINRTNSLGVQAFWIDGDGAADIINWTIGTQKSRAASGGTFNTEAPSVLTTIVDSMAFGFGAERTAAAETESQLTIAGTGWTKQGVLMPQTASGATLTIASKPMPTADATGIVTFTSVNTQTVNGAALQVIIPGAGNVSGPPATVSGHLWDGTQARAGSWYVMGSNNAVVPLDFAGMIHPGAPSIASMLAENVFYCAHRGGSANWPEHSMQGYTQSALRGYDALEISLARTSDGVWFGLHDPTLDRTSLGTGGSTLTASSMTWAQVQGYTIRPATGAPVDALTRPYMTLADLLDAYMKTHVIFVDPKSAGGSPTFRAELIALLQAREGWQSKIVAKAVPGSGNNAWLVEARAAGFTTNAMFYPADNFAGFHNQGDILGMSYDASEAVWATIVGYGKPVMAHVCPSQATVNTGLTKGAKGAMVSGVVQAPRVPGL